MPKKTESDKAAEAADQATGIALLEPKEEKKEEPAKNLPTPIPMENNRVAPQTLEQEYRLATMYLRSGVLPSRFKSETQIVAALQFAKENHPGAPLTALRQIAIIEGVPTEFGDLPLSKVKARGKLISHEEFIFDKDYQKICFENKNLNADVYGAICRVVRDEGNGKTSSFESCFTMDDAKKASIIRNVWLKYPKYMLIYRARAWALKTMFADALNGAAIGEYDFNARINDGGTIEGEVVESTANQLNQRFLTDAKEETDPKSGASE